MEEKYLHLIWEMKRFPSRDFVSVEGFEIEILSFGIRNDDLAGPDFFYGKVRYDGMVHYGMIEIHVKSSDWYRHKHHADKRYNNVVLHVVYEYDKPVIQNNVEIPTIELKQFIDQEHYLKFRRGRLDSLPILCRSQLRDIPSVYLESMKSRAVIEKLMQKYITVSDMVGLGRKELLFALITLAFGTSKNKYGFERILQRLPVEKVFKEGQFQKRRYVREMSAVFEEYKETVEWNYKGLRPQGSPDIRLVQLISTLESINLDHFTGINSSKLIENEIKEFINNLEITAFMKQQLLINAFVPFLWGVGLQDNDEGFKELALDMLEKVNAENNHIVRRWKQQGLKAKTAYDSQALLGLYRYYCSHKKCLSCAIGLKLLKP
jgi:hypothetical protein